MEDQKVENLLNLALEATPRERQKSLSLNVGYDSLDDTWDVIVKYTGDLSALEEEAVRIVPLIGQYAVVTLREDRLEDLAGSPLIEYVEKPKRLFFQVDGGRAASCIDGVQNAAFGLFGQGVLVAVIDSGIDYTHPDFCTQDGRTRILALWDQSLEAQEGERPPQGYHIGVEYTGEAIDRALEAGGEEQARLVRSRDLSGHGTAVAGIAAGNGRASGGRYRGVASESPLLVVKLGNPRQGSEGFPRTTELMQGVDYVVKKAVELKMPVAVNLSFGNTYGSHDGTSLLETYLDNVAGVWKNVLCVGTGNEANRAGHTEGFLKEGELREVEFAVSSYETALNIQIWKSYADDFDIAVRHPSGETVGPLQQVLGPQRFRLRGTEILVYYGEPSPYSRAQEIYLEFLPDRDYLDDGIWAVQLFPRRLVTGNYDMWMPSAQVLNEGTGFVLPVEETTLTIPSSARKVLSVGAYDARRDVYAGFSGRGYTREMRAVKPDLAAPGVNMIAPASGGGYRQVTGTSFAVPFVTGASALLMQYGIVQGSDPYLYGEKVKASLIRGARPVAGEQEYPNRRVGYGALCVRDSLGIL